MVDTVGQACKRASIVHCCARGMYSLDDGTKAHLAGLKDVYQKHKESFRSVWTQALLCFMLQQLRLYLPLFIDTFLDDALNGNWRKGWLVSKTGPNSLCISGRIRIELLTFYLPMDIFRWLHNWIILTFDLNSGPIFELYFGHLVTFLVRNISSSYGLFLVHLFRYRKFNFKYWTWLSNLKLWNFHVWQVFLWLSQFCQYSWWFAVGWSMNK